MTETFCTGGAGLADERRMASLRRLAEVREKIEKLAELPPENRDYEVWRRLVEEERKLMQRIADQPDSDH